MYSQSIQNRLANLKYLKPLKNSNISILSKTNNYNDVVKFYAKINADNIIQTITYKATGCSSFIAMCDYFCEIVQGKTIEDAKALNEENLKVLASLDKSREHVYDIIISTFKLLIKKYQKGIEKGKIKPIEVIAKQENIEESQEEVLNDIIDEETIDIISESDDKKVELDIINDNLSNNEDNQTQILEVVEEVKVEEKTTNNIDEKTITQERKTSHLMALRQKISNKENNDKAHSHTNSLNSLLASITNKSKKEDEKEEKSEELKKPLFSWLKRK